MTLITWYTYNLMIYRLLRSRRGQGRRWWRRPVNKTFFNLGEFSQLFQELKNTDHEEFYSYTRMTPDQFYWLLEKTKPYLLKRSKRRPFPPELRLAVTLGYLSHADSVWSKKWAFRIGRSTVYKIIPETCNAIIRALQPIYLSPMTREDWHNVAHGFREQWNFPNCVGAVDGKHIRIQAPKNSGSLYFNYKKFFSMVLMAACDANYVFTWVDIGDYGSISDGGIWLHSDFGSSLEQGLIELPHPEPLLGTNDPFPFAFVGDEAFPLKIYFMRPYAKKRLRYQQEAPVAQTLTIPEKIFNYRLSRARRVIENAFGILVSKWAILRGSLCCKPENAETIVMALICLHNFLMDSEKNILPAQRMYQNPGLIDGNGPNGEPLQNGEWRAQVPQHGMIVGAGRLGANNPNRTAINQRDKLRDYFLTQEGEVLWQYDNAIRNVPIIINPL